MELYIRFSAVVLFLFWMINMIVAARRPPEWRVESQPNSLLRVRFSRQAWLVVSTAGITVAILLFSLAPQIALPN